MRLCAALAIGAAWVAMGYGQVANDRTLAFLEERVKSDREDFFAWNRLGDLVLARFRETGRIEWLRRAGEAADASLKIVGPELNPAALSLCALVDLAEHRFAQARERARELRRLQPANSAAVSIVADASLELGDMEEAARLIAELAEMEPGSVVAEARLARLALLRGGHDAAREHFTSALEAARQLIPPVPSTLAWCHVQLGALAFRTGRWSDAEAAYQAALETMPGWWGALDHLAELRAAQGRDAEAVELFTRVAAATDRPELWQSLGDFHLFQKRPAEAKIAHDRALAGYRSSPELYVHHLAGFFADSQEDAAEAVKCARRDLESRQGPYAWDALAWALYKNRELPAALDAAKRSLTTGLADPHVLYHAAMIHLSAGDVAEGQRLLKRAAEVNPHWNAFHSHR